MKKNSFFLSHSLTFSSLYSWKAVERKTMKFLYSLTTIEDQATPLAPAPKTTFQALVPWITGVLVVLILVLVALITRYALSCSRERARIAYITEEYKLKTLTNLPKWNLSELREIRQDLEASVVMGSLE